MADAGPTSDPYLIPRGGGVLRNKLGLVTAERLKQLEADHVHERLLAIEEDGPTGRFDFKRLLNTHRYLFQDVYDWAGEVRRGMAAFGKADYEGGTVHEFTPEAKIISEADRIFGGLRAEGYLVGLGRATFTVRAAKLLAAINDLHPFREGNR